MKTKEDFKEDIKSTVTNLKEAGVKNSKTITDTMDLAVSTAIMEALIDIRDILYEINIKKGA